MLLLACGPEPGQKPCTPTSWYADQDGDGFGDPADVIDACTADSRVLDASDCDDTDPDAHPDADEPCDAVSDLDCDGVAPATDADADGWAACEDCDDADATINPAAAELCDGVDQDCDTTIDDDAFDAVYVYADTDGDGFGDPAVFAFACSADAGWALTGDDCDDLDATVNPDAIEACNAADDDCDGAIDDVEDLEPWYTDADGDGFGDPLTAERTCEPATDAVATAGDCDDADATVSPDAEELCNGIDDDCDGDVDVDAVDADDWFTDGDGDGWGEPSSARWACEQPVTWIARGADCDDADADANPDAVELCDGHDDDCDGDVDEPDAADATTWYADTDGDGWGGAGLFAIGCDAPPDHYASAEDCDDGDASVSPDAPERCDGIDNDCDFAVDEDSAVDAVTWYVDADGDGAGSPGSAHVACAGDTSDGTDCDDADGAVHPAAAERCDGVDQDCNGVADDAAVDAETWSLDADGDGWGDAVDSVVSCEALEGRSTVAGDCDDLDPDTHPSATEDCEAAFDRNCDGFTGTGDADGDGTIACEDCDDGDATRSPAADERCDGLDQDCDGETDEEPLDGSAFYEDLDGDGFGDPVTLSFACELPTDAVVDATDCDDGDAAVSPDGVETCATAADDDCSGTDNDDDALSCADWYLDFDRDGAGSLTSRCLCSADGLFSSSSSDDCDDGDAAISPLIDEVWANGIDDDCDEDVDTISPDSVERVLYGEAGQDAAGTTLAGIGDADGDGLGDYLIGAPGQDTNGSGSGAAYLVRGGATGDLDLSLAYAIVVGADAGDAVSAVAGGDLDGDGLAEVFVGAAETGSSQGSAYLLRGPVVGTIDVANADTTLAAESLGDRAGGKVAIGDFDGDGLGDLAVAGTGDDDGGSAAGAIWVVYLPAGAGLRLTDADVKGVGEDASDHAGSALDAGDLDGDGIDDLLVGATGDDDAATDAGAVYLLKGPLSGWTDLSAHDGKYVGELANDEIGEMARFAGDLDGDGLRDLVVGAPGNGVGGTLWAYGGPGAAVIHRTSEAIATWSGAALDDELGVAAVSPGDLDRDGQDDLAVAASREDTAASSAGAVYLYFGPFAGTYSAEDAASTLYGGATNDYAGTSLAAPGDTDGDGIPDLLVGAIGADDGGSAAGAVYLLLGPG